eukprot:COSAG06_NODE_32958_length_497_cov_1.414573_1_plen_62_part_10
MKLGRSKVDPRGFSNASMYVFSVTETVPAAVCSCRSSSDVGEDGGEQLRGVCGVCLQLCMES